LLLLLASLLTSQIPTTDQLVLLFVPLPHFGVSQVLLVLSLPGTVYAQASIGFDDAAEGHAGHLEETFCWESVLVLWNKVDLLVLISTS
jgi:hypothetical protein